MTYKSSLCIFHLFPYVVDLRPFHLFLGPDSRQAGDAKSVRVSSLQDQTEGPHLCLDIQFENQRKAVKMDFGGSCTAIANLNYHGTF